MPAYSAYCQIQDCREVQCVENFPDLFIGNGLFGFICIRKHRILTRTNKIFAKFSDATAFDVKKYFALSGRPIAKTISRNRFR